MWYIGSKSEIFRPSIILPFQVQNSLYELEMAEGLLEERGILEYTTTLKTNLALNSSWHPGSAWSNGISSNLLQNLTLGINVVSIRVNGIQVCLGYFENQ